MKKKLITGTLALAGFASLNGQTTTVSTDNFSYRPNNNPNDVYNGVRNGSGDGFLCANPEDLLNGTYFLPAPSAPTVTVPIRWLDLDLDGDGQTTTVDQNGDGLINDLGLDGIAGTDDDLDETIPIQDDYIDFDLVYSTNSGNVVLQGQGATANGQAYYLVDGEEMFVEIKNISTNLPGAVTFDGFTEAGIGGGAGPAPVYFSSSFDINGVSASITELGTGSGYRYLVGRASFPPSPTLYFNNIVNVPIGDPAPGATGGETITNLPSNSVRDMDFSMTYDPNGTPEPTGGLKLTTNNLRVFASGQNLATATSDIAENGASLGAFIEPNPDVTWTVNDNAPNGGSVFFDVPLRASNLDMDGDGFLDYFNFTMRVWSEAGNGARFSGGNGLGYNSGDSWGIDNADAGGVVVEIVNIELDPALSGAVTFDGFQGSQIMITGTADADIVSASRSGGVVTLETEYPLTLSPGDEITVLRLGFTGDDPNGTFTVDSQSGTTITYTQAGGDETFSIVQVGNNSQDSRVQGQTRGDATLNVNGTPVAASLDGASFETGFGKLSFTSDTFPPMPVELPKILTYNEPTFNNTTANPSVYESTNPKMNTFARAWDLCFTYNESGTPVEFPSNEFCSSEGFQIRSSGTFNGTQADNSVIDVAAGTDLTTISGSPVVDIPLVWSDLDIDGDGSATETLEFTLRASSINGGNVILANDGFHVNGDGPSNNSIDGNEGILFEVLNVYSPDLATGGVQFSGFTNGGIIVLGDDPNDIETSGSASLDINGITVSGTIFEASGLYTNSQPVSNNFIPPTATLTFNNAAFTPGTVTPSVKARSYDFCFAYDESYPNDPNSSGGGGDLEITDCAYISPSSFSITFDSESGKTYKITGSSDLTSFTTDLATGITGTGGSVTEAFDPQGLNFFRVEEE